LLHHEVDRFRLRRGERPSLEDGAPRADEIEEAVRVDVLFEKGAVGRMRVDVLRVDVDAVLLQKTSGVAAGGSGGLQVKRRLRHLQMVPHPS